MTDPRSPSPRAVAARGHLPWRVVIPVKDAGLGKSRLAPATRGDPADRVALNRAIAGDTIAAAVAALGHASVLVVTSDAALTESSAQLGVAVVPDPGSGLNRAIEAGLARMPGAARSQPLTPTQAGGWAEPEASAGQRQAWPRAALLGDVPCLTAGDLLSALSQARRHEQSFVPDAQGVGTVLRCSTTTSPFVPRFGTESAAQHAADGAVRLALDLPRLRNDVDDLTSLVVAQRLGLGPLTRRVLDRLESGWIAQMQASVHTFDPEQRTGSVLRDDGLELRFNADAFDASGLRLLRVGQRLTVDVVDGEVVALGVTGIGGPIR